MTGNEISGFTGGDTIELAGITFSNPGSVFGADGEDTYTVATAGTLTIDAAGSEFLLLIEGATVGESDFTLSNQGITRGQEVSDNFQQATAASSGALAGDYLWSNKANWSNDALPVNGQAVTVGSEGYDDLASLSLSSLTETTTSIAIVRVTDGALSIGNLIDLSPENSSVYADGYAAGATGPVVVTVDTITGGGGFYGAVGSTSSFIDLSATDPGANYNAELGGTVIIAATLSEASVLGYNPEVGLATGSGTIALGHPNAVNSGGLQDVAPGDVLELPGDKVMGASFAPGSITLATNAGSYVFDNVEDASPVSGYSATFDSATGLEAITFTGPDVFKEGVKATTGLLAGDYLWSNPANWTSGTVPVNGGSVYDALIGYDDLPALSLTSLTLVTTGDANVRVTGGDLSIGDLINLSPENAGLQADGYAGAATTPVVVTVNTLAGAGGFYGASGSTSSFIDLSATDPGENYNAEIGGTVIIAATLSEHSVLGYNPEIPLATGSGTIAIDHPNTVNSGGLQDLTPGDVLELPGDKVTGVSFGAGSITLATNAGSYVFDNVEDSSPVSGYTASFDSATGLEAITFTGPDVFKDGVKATTGLLAGDYLWSNPANWASGTIPVDGNSVYDGLIGYDDLPALSLTSLTLATTGDAIVRVTNGDLNIGDLINLSPENAGLQAYGHAVGSTTQVVITVNTLTGAGGFYGAVGSTSSLIDLSATDPGENYTAEINGTVLIAATLSEHSVLGYNPEVGQTTGSGTIALEHPNAVNSGGLQNLAPGDVLELPGNGVTGDSFGQNSITLSTNAGSYVFDNVSDIASVAGFAASHDEKTGLEAFTFTNELRPGSADVIGAAGVSQNTTVGNGGILLLAPGGTADATALHPGSVEAVFGGGTSNHTRVGEGAAEFVLGSSNNAKIQYAGLDAVGPGGTVTGATIDPGGVLYLFQGGSAANTTISGGTEFWLPGSSFGNTTFIGNGGVLSLAGTVLPDGVITGFGAYGATGNKIDLTGFTYSAANDFVTLGKGNVVTLDLDGSVQKLFFDPTQDFNGQSFSITTNSFDQVVLIDPKTGSQPPQMNFVATTLQNAFSEFEDYFTINSADLLSDITVGLSVVSQLPAAGQANAMQFETDILNAFGANLGSLTSFGAISLSSYLHNG